MAQVKLPDGVMDVIAARRSVRRYAPDRLDAMDIHTLLTAAVRAPTAIHEEPWAFVIVQDSGLLRILSERCRALFIEEIDRSRLDMGKHALDAFLSPDFNIFYDAGTLIVICAKPMGRFVIADCWLAAENLMLAACAMGLGSCVIGSAVSGLNTEDVKAELGIPADMMAVAPIIVGVPDGETAMTTRNPPQILAWRQPQ